MANPSFTRDEAILALDVLFFHGNERLSIQSPIMMELSELLNSLPIYKPEIRPSYFRNPSGVLAQINAFRRSFQKGEKAPNVGKVFYEVANEFEGRLDELHEIAMAIRKNVTSYNDVTFGSVLEADSFPEGSLLGHLHRIIEKRDGSKLIVGNRCTICEIELDELYYGCSNLMSLHLTVPITRIDGKKKYTESDFITVCPNCHAVLHQYRPWLSAENSKDILK